MIKVRAKLIELWTRYIKYDERKKVYNNGLNNLYPNEIERVVANSPTASRSARMLSKFISGRDVIGGDLVVNKKKGYTIKDIARQIADDLSIHNGCFIHIGYGINENGEFYPNKFQVLDYIRCRISREDDEGYEGKIYENDWEAAEEEGKKALFGQIRPSKDARWYYPYNDNQEIISAQIAASEGRNFEEKLKNYRGQVYYLNLTPKWKYAVSVFDGVYNDCDTEYRMSLYSNSMVRGGFLGKVAVITQGLDEEHEQEMEKHIQSWLGVENSGHIYHMAVEQAEELDSVMRIEQVPSQYDDDMFNNTDKRIRRNISGAANNIPEPLIYSSEGALWGTQGETYREMKEFFDEQTQEERKAVENFFLRMGYDIKIIGITEEPEQVLQ